MEQEHTTDSSYNILHSDIILTVNGLTNLYVRILASVYLDDPKIKQV